ncbi:zinc ABC transporter substrate-binding protein [Caballeronia sp. LZ002]|nr:MULTISPECIES: zinc ABC transporter substrate-binding protein [unclassified Caballeronia]MDR5777409.1 zinc ABC transporter substrate-binding protein [Caballeronia sp. LZ002]MDR5852847.1 zinc ABC transporter substrate-binding protein [Caballeronia sp. LZ003]
MLFSINAVAAAPIKVVAAENFYGDVARQIGGSHVQVTSILSNPDQDPHLFEASPSVGKALANAKLVVYNGADYDPWMTKLLAGSKSSSRQEIVVGELLNKKSGANPHLWYQPDAMPTLAKQLASSLQTSDPTHAADYSKNLQTFLASLRPIDARVDAIKAKYSGTPVTATEPVFGYMAQALGLEMRNGAFQNAIMNDTEPAASDVAAFEGDLKDHRVHVLIYNSQATGGMAKRMRDLANQSGVPVVGVTETAPAGKTYQAWVLDELNAVDKALAKSSK